MRSSVHHQRPCAISPRARRATAWRYAALAGPWMLAACAASPNHVAAEAPRMAFAALNGPHRAASAQRLASLPVVLEFRKGERIPVELQLDSSFARLDARELEIVVERDFYVLMHADGPPLFSLDGANFEADAKKYFRFGMGVQKGYEAVLQLHIGIHPDGKLVAFRAPRQRVESSKDAP